MTAHPAHPDPHELAGRIKAKARALGFDLVGIAPAQPSQYRDYLRRWLDTGQAGEMTYLAQRFDERTDPAVYLPGAQSVVCVAMNYHVQFETDREGGAPAEPPALGVAHPSMAGFAIPPPRSTAGPNREPTAEAVGHPLAPQTASGKGRIARYALGDDYHDIIKPRLHALADWLRTQIPNAQTRAAVDTAPVMEKELAARAGIGWMGKNTCIIHEDIGSWLFLGEIVTTLPLPPDQPAIDRCGSCTRCLDACPTGAITAPYQLDACRCISYLTIEHRGDVPAEFHKSMGSWLYGCDICQDVCPWNRKAPDTSEPTLQPRFPGGEIDLAEILSWNEEAYRSRLRHSAMRRVKLPLLQRNARIAGGSLHSSLFGEGLVGAEGFEPSKE